MDGEGSGRVDDRAAAAPLDDLFDDTLSDWRGRLVWHRPAGAISALDLGGRKTFSGLIDRFQAAQGGQDRMAAVSFWSQIYFSRLIIPAAVAILARE